MSSSLYFLRHGESQANIQGVLCGSAWDAELTLRGKRQVLQRVSAIKTLGIQTIITSPLLRARSSAELLNSSLHLAVDPDLQEQFYGNWEGVPFHQVKAQFLERFDPPGGEPYSAFRTRIIRALEKVLLLDGPALIVSHGGVGSELLDLLGHQKRLIENAELYRLI